MTMCSSNTAMRGQRLLPSLVDEIAETDSGRILYSICKTQNPADGFTDIDARMFARAVNRCSRYVEQQLGRGENFPTLTYMGPQDLVYAILILACIKTGYKLLLNSPRNSLEAHLSLFEQTECSTFLMPHEFPLPVVKQILAHRDMRVVEIAGLQHWLSEGDDEVYPYYKSFSEAKEEPFVVLHTSGSTGLPKPVVQTHGTWTPQDAFCDLPALGYKPTYPASCAGSRLYTSFPLFHCAGVSMILPAPIYCGFTPVLGPFPPSAEVANGIHVHGNVQCSCLVPTTLVDLVRDPTYLENLSHVKQIIYGGGPCPQAVGELVNTRTRLISVLGSTEAGVLPVESGDPEDWAYMKMSPALGSEFRHVSGDLYEHFIVRSEDLASFQGIFGTFPSLREWPMKDLYSKHPTKDDVWLYRGRTDDIVVLANGEKFNPLAMEETINGDPNIRGALISGVGRFQSSLLVEAMNAPGTEAKKLELLDIIWPSIQAANKLGPAHSHIHRNMVTFASLDKPMLRAGKGTIQRKMTLDLYRNELESLYLASESGTVVKSGAYGDTSGTTADLVRRIVSAAMDINADSVKSKANLFEFGLDSLQVIAITRGLNEVLLNKGQHQSVQPRIIYANPTIERLTRQIDALIEGHPSSAQSDYGFADIQATYDRLRAALPITARQARQSTGPQVVLLTGSTGSLGSYILDSLCSSTQIQAVFCLNRGHASGERQKISNAAKGLFDHHVKVTYLDCDYTLPFFGLPLPTYKQLLEQVTFIIHNAWQVDFNLALSSFATQLQTVRYLVDFSAHSLFGARIFFISSISTVAKFRAATGNSTAVPEQIFNDWSISQKAGYGQSKLVAERLLDAAAREVHIPTTVCRVGQVAGPTTREGIWPKQEWLPSLIASSKYLGKLPDSLGPQEHTDWIPADQLGRIIVELATSGDAEGSFEDTRAAAVYHLVNPRQTTWAELVPAIRKYLGPSAAATSTAAIDPIEVVSLREWVEALRQSKGDLSDVARNPAVKILDFFEDMACGTAESARLDVKNSTRASKTFADLESVTSELIENWLRQWDF